MAHDFKDRRRQKQAILPVAPNTPLPNASESEKVVIGCCINFPDTCLTSVVSQVEGPETFYDLRNRQIYESLVEMARKGAAIDTLSLYEWLKERDLFSECGGLAYVNGLPDVGTVPQALDTHLLNVIAKHRARKIVTFCAEWNSKAHHSYGDSTELLGEFQREAIGLSKVKDSDVEHDAKTCALRFADDVEERFNRQGAPSGILTGFADYDRLTDGLQYGEQFIVGARPSQGKTALGLCVLNHACLKSGVPALFVSLEMTTKSVMRRFAAIHSHIDMRNLRTGQLTEKEGQQLPVFNKTFSRSSLTVLDYSAGAGANTIAAAIKRHADLGVKLVVIDYLQKISAPSKSEKRTYEVAEVSGILKAAAVQNNVAMVTLAQLNREPDKGGKSGASRLPRVSDLADSAQIERDADVIGLLYREPESQASALIIGKNRDGECGIVKLHFNGQYCEFTNGTGRYE